MSEGRLVRAILVALNARPHTKAIKLHGNAFTEAGTPDVLGGDARGMFAIEVKLPGKKIKAGGIQEKRLAEWAGTGARVGVATTVAEAVAIVQA